MSVAHAANGGAAAAAAAAAAGGSGLAGLLGGSGAGNGGNPVAALHARAQQTLRRWLDRAAPHVAPRWAALAAVAALYAVRVLLLRGFYIVTYGLGIYNLNLLLGFITPAVDPEATADDDDAAALPTKSDQEFRPFVRRLPEFKFWWASLRSVLVGFALTFFPPADLPVFWPILLVYWVALFGVTMRRQVKHMIKHRYLPFDLGRKERYGAGGGGSGGGGRRGGAE
jgi:hypothetical protein